MSNPFAFTTAHDKLHTAEFLMPDEEMLLAFSRSEYVNREELVFTTKSVVIAKNVGSNIKTERFALSAIVHVHFQEQTQGYYGRKVLLILIVLDDKEAGNLTFTVSMVANERMLAKGIYNAVFLLQDAGTQCHEDRKRNFEAVKRMVANAQAKPEPTPPVAKLSTILMVWLMAMHTSVVGGDETKAIVLKSVVGSKEETQRFTIVFANNNNEGDDDGTTAAMDRKKEKNSAKTIFNAFFLF